MKSLQEIADYYTRLRLAGMTEHEIEIMKKSITITAIINKLDVLTLLSDCVSHYEGLQLKISDRVESEIVLNELRSKGVRIVE